MSVKARGPIILERFELLVRDAHYAAILAPGLEVDGLVVVVDDRF
jgi:hypothetical protein